MVTPRPLSPILAAALTTLAGLLLGLVAVVIWEAWR
jgi:hypothetical protein